MSHTRVLLVDTGSTWRGGQQQVAHLAAGLTSSGFETRVWAAPGSGLADAARRAGTPAAEHRRPRGDLSLRAALGLRQLAREIGADIVHAHDARAHATARLAQALGSTATLVVTRRVTRVPRGRWKYLRGVSRYIAISRAVQQSLEGGGIPPGRIDVVPSGISIPAPSPGTVLGSLEHRDPLVVGLSALTREKGVATVVEAAARLARQSRRIRWVIAGDGPLRAELEALAARLGAPVRFVGFLEEPDQLLQQADLLVQVSRAEGLGTAVLEGLSRGVPAVVSNVGGLASLVPATLGTVVPAGDPTAVAEAVAAWLDDPGRRASARINAPRWAGRYSVERMVEGTVRSYRKALALAPPNN